MSDSEKPVRWIWRLLWASVIAYIPLVVCAFLLSRKFAGNLKPAIVFWIVYAVGIGALGWKALVPKDPE